jgi:rod shape-determining protein MreD
MTRVWLTASVLLLFILEGTVVQVISPTAWGLSWMAVPRFALVSTILIAMLLGRREGLYYGLAFGFLQDVLYGNVIGIYMMSMAMAGYFSGLIVLLFQRGFGMVLVTCLLILFGHEWLLYSLFRLFAMAPEDVRWIVVQQILPTVILNTGLAVFIYQPFKRMCKKIEAKKEVPSME